MNKFQYFGRVTALAMVMTAAALAAPALAATTYYVHDTALTVGTTPLRIQAGSAVSSLTVNGNSFTVTVPSAESFTIIAPGIYPLALSSTDPNLVNCNVIQNRDNQILVTGPRTVTFTPNTVPCDVSNYTTNKTPTVDFSQPQGGETLTPGQSYQMFWQVNGQGVSNVRIRLSTDGGATFATTVLDNSMNNGYYSWTVPDVYAAAGQAYLMLQGMDGMGQIVAVEVSGGFAIAGTPPATPPAPPATNEPTPGPTYDFSPSAVTTAATSIDVNQGLVLPAGTTSPCVDGILLKGHASAAVYYCGADGKRHPFPNQKIYDSWYAGSFAGVATVTDAELASVPLGTSVSYRPGVRLVKITTDPKVYAVGANGELRWVSSELVARVLYGNNWNTMVDDLSDAFFSNYKIGKPIS